MRVDAVLDGAGPDAGPVEVRDLAYDSRRVVAGTLFFCVPGLQADGHDHAPEAVRRGATALVVERPLHLGVPEVVVPSARAAMATAAARFHGDPTARLRLVGVTGTNGKTTTAFLVRALLEASGVRCGLLGTVKSVVGGVEHDVSRTTPEAIDLQRDLRAMLDAGDAACAMEVSSHALALGRADALHFAAAIFTNLTQDHLDFHETMEDYFLAKRRLFAPEIGPHPSTQAPDVSVVNLDDPYGRRLTRELPGVITFALERDADYRARDVRTGLDGATLRLVTPAGERELRLPLRGRFNVHNALGALAAVHHLGFDLDVLAGALAEGVRVPGRFEAVQEGQPFAVLVDYAHTPDSLENVLRAARELTRGRLVCVFGAGGDRDRGKRPLMGEAAASLADVVVVTSDNPRSEVPQAIIDDVMTGVRRAAGERTDVHEVVDRREAITLAIEGAEEADVVVIAGKGHEQGQEFANGDTRPFDDVSVAREALRARGGTPAAA